MLGPCAGGVGCSGQDRRDNVRVQCVARVATSTLSTPRVPTLPTRRIFGQTTQTERRSPRVVSVGNAPSCGAAPSTERAHQATEEREGPGTRGFVPLGLRFASPPSGVVSGGWEKNTGRGKRGCAALTGRSPAVHCMYPARRHRSASTGFLAPRRPLDLASLPPINPEFDIAFFTCTGPAARTGAKSPRGAPADPIEPPPRHKASQAHLGDGAERRQVPAGEETRCGLARPPAPLPRAEPQAPARWTDGDGQGVRPAAGFADFKVQWSRAPS